MTATVPTAHTLDILRRLIAFPTVSRDSNLGLIEWVRDDLARQGVRSRLTYDAGRKKANLFATIGEGARPGLILSGHTDVVPVDGQAWDSDPFVATEKDGRIYGRGSADMKGFIACALAAVPMALAAHSGSGAAAPLHLALSYDEELGCLGVRGLVKDLEEIGLKAAGCIIGEPTSMDAVVGHKGGLAYRCCVSGREVHSALAPQGVNAVEYAAMMIARIRQMADGLRANEQRNDGFDVPFTTMQSNWIQGGIASNVVARDCEFRFDVRHLAWTDPDALVQQLRDYAQAELLPRMREVEPDADIRIEEIGAVHGFQAEEDAPLTAYVQRLSGSARRRYVGFGTEAGFFQRIGIPAVVCGPGSIEQAHKPNEFIALEQLARCESFMQALAGSWQGDMESA